MNLPFYRRIDTCNEGRSRGTSFDKYISLRNPWDVSSKKFVDQWGDGENSFAEDPPNAVVSFLEDGDATPEEVTVTIRDPQLDGDTLTYTIDILDGKLPAKAGPCALFIDPIGRPLSPMSVAGVRRRGRRR